LANTTTSTTSSAYGQIDSTGQVGTVTVKGGKLLDLSIDYDSSTAFVGTIILQRETLTGASNAAEFQNVETYTASAEKVIRSATTRRYRLDCTVATSGTAEYELTAGNFN